MASLKTILGKIAPGWWEVITRVAIMSMIVGAYWWGRLGGEYLVGSNMGMKIRFLKQDIEGLNVKNKNLHAKLRQYEEREKSRTSSDTNIEKPLKNE